MKVACILRVYAKLLNKKKTKNLLYTNLGSLQKHRAPKMKIVSLRQ